MTRTFTTYDDAIMWAASTGKKFSIVVTDVNVFVMIW